MKIPFYKYHGTGNDFILIDNRLLRWDPVQEQVAFLCDRHYGIGADGLIFLNEGDGYDFGMSYFNSDGNESTMCGNGGRCITAFACTLGIISDEAHFRAIDGEHRAKITNKQEELIQVRLKMKDVFTVERVNEAYFLDTGSPHYVTFCDDPAKIDVVQEGRKIRHGSRFEENGTNVNFVAIMDDHLYVRTYERGVENETLSCGTGITASAIAAAIKRPDNPGFFKMKAPGGELIVSFKQNGDLFTDIWLEGPTKFVFKGEIVLDGEVVKW